MYSNTWNTVEVIDFDFDLLKGEEVHGLSRMFFGDLDIRSLFLKPVGKQTLKVYDFCKPVVSLIKGEADDLPDGNPWHLLGYVWKMTRKNVALDEFHAVGVQWHDNHGSRFFVAISRYWSIRRLPLNIINVH